MIDGRKLRSFREKRSYTQKNIADALGVSKQTISQAERTPNVGLDTAERYLNAILKLDGRRERVILTIALSWPMGGVHADLVPELQEVIS